MMSLFTSSVLNSEPVEGGTNSVVVGQVLHGPHGSNSGTSEILFISKQECIYCAFRSYGIFCVSEDVKFEGPLTITGLFFLYLSKR